MRLSTKVEKKMIGFKDEKPNKIKNRTKKETRRKKERKRKQHNPNQKNNNKITKFKK